ncbi:MAG TPA: Gfo/Idh/MocA family oxidoreductase [Candidatus Eisenbacteria bacterium]|nr:Gfo/Idh/MocA family oxidoreductase [Candidatus Eisenbacteria bacterium]
MRTLKTALVGSGYIAGVKHLPALKNLKGRSETVAIVDLNEAQARDLAGKFGVPKVYKDVGEMLRTEKPDVVDICTPPKTHTPIALQCIEGGAHVLIEKPMCQTEAECDTVMAAAEKAKRKICVGHSDLFYPSFNKGRELFEKGEIGAFRGMRIHLSTPVDYITSKPDHWAHKLPGGVFGESGPHVVYMTLAYISPIRDVQIVGRKMLPEYPWSPYEDYRLNLIGDQGTCTISMIYTTKQWQAEVAVWGTEGTLHMDLETQKLLKIKREELKMVPVALGSLGEVAQTLGSGLETGMDLLTGRYTQTHQEMMRAFFDAIVNDTDSPVPPSQGKESIRVMNMITAKL